MESNSLNKIPNSIAVLVLGIISFFACCCCNPIGIILAVIGLILAKKGEKLYLENPNMYNKSNELKIGKILCIAGLVINFIYLIFNLVFTGADVLFNSGMFEELYYTIYYDVF